MQFLRRIVMLWMLTIPLYAADMTPVPKNKPLVIAIDPNTPPFVMEGGKQELYGYDIGMMQSLCKIMKRSCKFSRMRWAALLPSVMNNEVDLAIGSITITTDRIKQLNFSIPYYLSYARLLANAKTQTSTHFSLDNLTGKKIGVEKGTVYEDGAAHLGIDNPKIIPFNRAEDILSALAANKISYALLDDPTALYWAANSSGAFKVVGKPYSFGYGIGIAVSKSDLALIPELNDAINEYLNSDDYRQNFHRFLESF